MIVSIDSFTGYYNGDQHFVTVYFNTVSKEFTVDARDSFTADPVTAPTWYDSTDRSWNFGSFYTDRILYDYCEGTTKVIVSAIESNPFAEIRELANQSDCQPTGGCGISIVSLSKSDETATGANNGSVTATVTGESCSSIEYSVDGINYQTSPTFPGLAPNTYNYIARDCAGCSALQNFTIDPFAPTAPEPDVELKKFDPVFNEILINASSFNSTQPTFKFIFDVYVNGAKVARRKQAPIYNDFQNAVFDVSAILKDFVTMGDFRKGNINNVINTNDESFVQYEVKIGESYGGTDYPELKSTGIRYAYSASLRQFELFTFITDDFKIFGNGCEILGEVDGGTPDDPISFVIGYFNGNTAPAGLDTCPTTSEIDGGLPDLVLDTINFNIDGNPPYVGDPGYNSTPNSAKKFLTFVDRWQKVGLKETYQLSILAEPGFEFSRIRVLTYGANGASIATTPIENVVGASGTHLQVKAGPRDLNRISPGVIGSNVTHYKIQIIGADDSLVSEQFGFLVSDNCTRFENFRLHYLNRLGGYDAFTFNKSSKKITKVERRSYQRNTGYKTNVNNFLTNQYRFDPAKLNYAISSAQNFTLNSDWITDRQSELFEDLYDSPIVYLESNKIEWGATNDYPMFIPVTIVNSDYETKTRANGKLFNVSIEIELGVSNRRQTR